jgi:hypothetical protein
LRLRGIGTIDAANQFLRERYINAICDSPKGSQAALKIDLQLVENTGSVSLNFHY